NPVTDGSTLTSSFLIQNYGNTAATDVVLTDTFSPAPNPITVTVGGTALTDADYDYTDGTLRLPGTESSYSLSVPAASFVQNTETGEIAVNPGAVTIVVAGTL
ncbi:MAG: hypothetical protein Q4C13_03965, partial [Clostridia bacterium]|nr:hypothetical protein [Clostridia bacterium]